MEQDTEKLLKSIMSGLKRMDSISIEDIPSIDLYMDQLTTFMGAKLKATKRYEVDKILTKTMINNYAKNSILPPPNNKKYGRRHIIMLIFIYYFKNVLSLHDIQKLTSPLIQTYFKKTEGLSLEDIYENVFKSAYGQLDDIQLFVEKTIEASEEICSKAKKDGMSDEEQEFLKYFFLICSLAFDAYAKRLMIEKLIDLMPETK